MKVNMQSPLSGVIALSASFLAGAVCVQLAGVPAGGQLAAPRAFSTPPTPTKTTAPAITGLKTVTADLNWKHEKIYLYSLVFDTAPHRDSYMGSNLGYKAYYYYNAGASASPNIDQIQWELIDCKAATAGSGTTAAYLLNLRFRAICSYARDHFNHPKKDHAPGTGNIIVISTSSPDATTGTTTDTSIYGPQPTNEE